MSNYVQKEFEERVIRLNRVSKKTRGGNRLNFSALVALGDGKSRVGVGYGKAKDVPIAISKAVFNAKRNLISVTKKDGTIPHEVTVKFKATKILLKPAKKGAGIIAGGAVRQVLELAGIKDISAKIFGSSNKISTVTATIEALKKLKD
ncbi:30S ribosomal protein S5 [candidate division WWE3 bacterium]|nr:30S ribosomal protein S5 [candidate division WWE3 bacterium]